MGILKKAYETFIYYTVGNPRFQLFGEYYYRVPTTEKTVALTFDDGPAEPYTRELLDVLEQHQVAATFFFVGQRIEANFELAKRVHQKGHQIGNHSYSHPHLIFKPFSFIRGEIERADAVIRSLGVTEKILFRAPYAQKLIGVPYVLSQMKRENILFDFFTNPRDWIKPGAPEIAQDIIARARPGSILLLHDGNRHAGPYVAKVAEDAIKGLKEKGYQFKTVSELLSLRRCAK